MSTFIYTCQCKGLQPRNILMGAIHLFLIAFCYLKNIKLQRGLSLTLDSLMCFDCSICLWHLRYDHLLLGLLCLNITATESSADIWYILSSYLIIFCLPYIFHGYRLELNTCCEMAFPRAFVSIFMPTFILKAGYLSPWARLRSQWTLPSCLWNLTGSLLCLLVLWRHQGKRDGNFCLQSRTESLLAPGMLRMCHVSRTPGGSDLFLP